MKKKSNKSIKNLVGVKYMEEEYWKKAEREGKAKKALEKELKEKYPYLGKKVRRRGISKWEEGIVVLAIPSWDENATEQEEFIQYSENDLEGLWGLPFEVWDEEKQKWIDR